MVYESEIASHVELKKSFQVDIENVTPSQFFETAEGLNHLIKKHTKGSKHPSSKRNTPTFVISDAFNHFVITNSNPHGDGGMAIDVILENWIISFGRPKTLVTNEVSKN